MDLKAVRKSNLGRAIEIAGGMSKLSEKADVTVSYLSQCMSDKIDKSIGAIVARRIESGLGFDEGWMDTPHGETEESNANAVSNLQMMADQLEEHEKEDLHEFVYLMIRRRKILSKYK